MKFTNKDLDYISDMFNWNYNALKLVNHYINEVESEEVKEVLEEVFDMHYENLTHCVDILEGKNNNIYYEFEEEKEIDE